MTTDFCTLSYYVRSYCAKKGWGAHDEEKFKLAINPNTPVEVLKVLATDKNWRVRIRVASNPSTPIESLNLLATDEDSWIREGVARNPNTPLEAFDDN